MANKTTKEIIEEFLSINVYNGNSLVKTQFVLNDVQQRLLNLIEEGYDKCGFGKYRIDGVTTLLCAWMAVRMYEEDNKKIAYIAPNMECVRQAFDKTMYFLEQLRAYKEMTPLYKIASRSGKTIELTNGSSVMFNSANSFINSARGRRFDAVLMDEAGFYKNYPDIRNLAVTNDGMIFETFTVADRKRSKTE